MYSEARTGAAGDLEANSVLRSAQIQQLDEGALSEIEDSCNYLMNKVPNI